MRASNYYRDLEPIPTTVLGLKLLPLSAGHLIRLNQVESAFIIGGMPSIEDLVLAVLICSRTFKESGELLRNPKLPKMLHRWQRKLCGQAGLLYWLGLRKPTPINFVEKIAFVHSHLKDGLEVPNHRFEAGDSRETNCPLVLMVMNELESKSHWTRDQLIDRPWKETVWDFLTLRLIDGSINQFIDEKAAEQINQSMEAAKELAKKLNPGTTTCLS